MGLWGFQSCCLAQRVHQSSVCVLEEIEPSYFAKWAELVPADRTPVQGPVTAFRSGTNMVPISGIWGLVDPLS